MMHKELDFEFRFVPATLSTSRGRNGLVALGLSKLARIATFCICVYAVTHSPMKAAFDGLVGGGNSNQTYETFKPLIWLSIATDSDTLA